MRRVYAGGIRERDDADHGEKRATHNRWGTRDKLEARFFRIPSTASRSKSWKRYRWIAIEPVSSRVSHAPPKLAHDKCFLNGCSQFCETDSSYCFVAWLFLPRRGALFPHLRNVAPFCISFLEIETAAYPKRVRLSLLLSRYDRSL